MKDQTLEDFMAVAREMQIRINSAYSHSLTNRK